MRLHCGLPSVLHEEYRRESANDVNQPTVFRVSVFVVQARKDTTIQGKRVAVSGSGNVAQFAVEKLLQLGAVPITMSDSSGTVYEANGLSVEQLAQIMAIKRNKGRLSELKLSPTGVLSCCTATVRILPALFLI